MLEYWVLTNVLTIFLVKSCFIFELITFHHSKNSFLILCSIPILDEIYHDNIRMSDQMMMLIISAWYETWSRPFYSAAKRQRYIVWLADTGPFFVYASQGQNMKTIKSYDLRSESSRIFPGEWWQTYRAKIRGNFKLAIIWHWTALCLVTGLSQLPPCQHQMGNLILDGALCQICLDFSGILSKLWLKADNV